MRINSAKDLVVYQKAYELAMKIFKLSNNFPPEEKFALTSQIRRSSRSVCLNLREAWAKRRYEAHSSASFTDCDSENSETASSLDFAKDCSYVTGDQHRELVFLCQEVGKMLGSMTSSLDVSWFWSFTSDPLISDLRPLSSDLIRSPREPRHTWCTDNREQGVRRRY